MENSITSKELIFNSAVAGLGTFFTYIFGGWDTVLIVLVSFMLMDYLTGVIAAFINHTVDSNIGFNGILRKLLILIVLFLAVMLDRLLNEGTWVFRTAVCYFYIGNEGISILENMGKCGIPLPDKLIKALTQLKGKDKEEEGDI